MGWGRGVTTGHDHAELAGGRLSTWMACGREGHKERHSVRTLSTYLPQWDNDCNAWWLSCFFKLGYIIFVLLLFDRHREKNISLISVTFTEFDQIVMSGGINVFRRDTRRERNNLCIKKYLLTMSYLHTFTFIYICIPLCVPFCALSLSWQFLFRAINEQTQFAFASQLFAEWWEAEVIDLEMNAIIEKEKPILC